MLRVGFIVILEKSGIAVKLILNEDLQNHPELINLYRLDAIIAYIEDCEESGYLDMCLEDLLKARLLYIAAYGLQDWDTE